MEHVSKHYGFLFLYHFPLSFILTSPIYNIFNYIATSPFPFYKSPWTFFAWLVSKPLFYSDLISRELCNQPASFSSPFLFSSGALVSASSCHFSTRASFKQKRNFRFNTRPISRWFGLARGDVGFFVNFVNFVTS